MYWKVKRHSPKVQLNCPTIPWSLWKVIFPLLIFTSCFVSSLDITHEFMPKINLKNFGPSQWSTLTDCLKSLQDLRKFFWGDRFSSLESACNINNSQCISVEFPQPCSHFVMREEKKFSLASCIWRFDIKSLSQDMLQGWRINLPDGLLHQPKLCNLLRHSGFFSQLLTAGNPFQKP